MEGNEREKGKGLSCRGGGLEEKELGEKDRGTREGGREGGREGKEGG